LEQTYVGEAAGDPGDKAKPPKLLVGETDKAYGLQPITDDSHDANASQSVTVVKLRIKSTPS
jgi:hypothetical protein